MPSPSGFSPVGLTGSSTPPPEPPQSGRPGDHDALRRTLHQSHRHHRRHDRVRTGRHLAGPVASQRHLGHLLPHNAATGRPYAGANILLLAIDALEAGYADNTWATYKQWQHLGGQVQRGEHGTRCIKWITKKTDSSESASSGDEQRRVLIPRRFTVFNIAQVDDYQPTANTGTEAPDRIENAEAFIAATGAEVDYEFNTAKYRPLVDRIQAPAIGQYRHAEDHYATLLNELVHWTGHQRQLARTFGERFGDDAYAAEDLVAELGAAFATARLGITNNPRPDHAAYLEHWRRILDTDPKALFAVAAKAQAAVDHLASCSQPAAEEFAA